VSALHVAETRPEGLAESAAKTGAKTASADYRDLIANPAIDAIIVSATPETTHYPMTRDALLAGKHVFLEKPIAIEFSEADELIALAREGRPILGIIDQPISRERWVGATGRASTFNGQPVRCRPCASLAAATIFATSPDMFRGDDAAAFARAAGAAQLVRYGADCYAYGRLALGLVDLVIEASLKTYDFSAMLPIVEGAGGVATDWQGRPRGLASDGRVLVAGDRRAHRAAQALLAG